MPSGDCSDMRGGVALVPLRRRDGTVCAYAFVDPVDWPHVARFTWRLHYEGYAIRGVGKRTIYMARELLGVHDPKIRTDHRNGDRLDNRRRNLRSGSALLNNQNLTVLRSDNRSAHRGVIWHKTKRRWWAYARLGGKQHSLGYHDTPEQAADAAQAFRAAHMPFSQEAA